MSDRVDWHTYFMNIARQVATRSTCPRKHVGAVIVRDRTILSLRFVAGMTQSEIGDELGISQMHVSRLLSRTLVKLRKGLTVEE